MILYFLLIRIAALFGHRKARMLVKGQAETLAKGREDEWAKVRGAIWFHAASVGEFEQARPLIERLKANGEGRKVVVTFFSPSGYEARKNFASADGVYYLPFATRRNARRFLDALQPKMAIFVKYEFWPAYLRELKKRAIPTYSICAIFRPKQLFFLPWGKQHLRLLSCFTHIFVQDEASRQLLAKHGVEHVSVAGDTRFDRMQAVTSQGMNELTTERLRPLELFTEGCERVIVAGSTWPKDEELLAQFQFRDEGLECRGSKLILVPHELTDTHLHYIFQLFKGRYVRYSDVMAKGEGRMDESKRLILQQAGVLVIDTMGLLSRIYRFGQVAYIGGGFGVGIHNTTEAAVYGLPVVFGPNHLHFREALGLIEHGAARSVSNYDELKVALDTALDRHLEIGAKAAEYVHSELGATDRIFEKIFV